jgi:hypothetical protein
MNDDEKANKDVKALIRILKRDFEIDLMDLRDSLRWYLAVRHFAFVIACGIVGTLALALISWTWALLYTGIRHYVGIE